ncbi:MAG: energy-coupling factor transporter ATPase [Syntrophomonadaceae bacterium]|jgi:energy-coupling factor transport system ATP-binding protein|nr:energy-coupling factor transporter ATPase [Syntrophomonadaceae bacterium]
MNGHGIQLINVGKEFKNPDSYKAALTNINLTIHEGEYIGILGLNQSGKSTLARLLNGLLKPSLGRILVNGMDVDSSEQIREIRQLLGIVFQNPDNQLICPVVEEEIAFGPENLGLSPSEVNKRVSWALEIVGMQDMRYHAPHLLSGGQKQKVALASVLAMEPSYLVLDEPTSMLDPVSRWEILEHLRKINKENHITIILISHNPEDLLDANRLIVLHEGFIYMQGTPREVYADMEKLTAIGLKPPGLYQLIQQLEEEGYGIDDNTSTIPQLVEKICQK